MRQLLLVFDTKIGQTNKLADYKTLGFGIGLSHHEPTWRRQGSIC